MRLSLDQLTVREPCHIPWDSMHRTGEGKRFCDQCQKPVHDLASLSREEADALVNCGTSVCVRMTYDPTGRLLTKPQPVSRPRRLWFLRHAAAVAGLLGLGSLFNIGCEPAEASDTPKVLTTPHVRTMGLVAVPQVQGEVVGALPTPTSQPSDPPTTGPSTQPVENLERIGKLAPPTTQPSSVLTTPYDGAEGILQPFDD